MAVARRIALLASLACGIATADVKPDPLPPETKDVKDEKPAPKKDVDPTPDLLALTNDPIVGNAKRIDGEETSGVVAFTFDDGPNPATTPAVIEALTKYNIPATFFIVTQRISGKSGEKARDVLAKELSGGFTIESHSVTHPNLKNASQKQLDKEIDASIRALSPQIGRPVGMFRPPYGALGPAGRVRLKKLGLTEVFWSIDTLDWASHNAERLRKRVFDMIVKQKGGVVLMHDVKPITAKIAAVIFDDLEAENCRRLAVLATPVPPVPVVDPTAPKPKKPPPPPPPRLEPILPVSLHYFLKDGKTPRAIPDDVKQRTEAYRLALPARCVTRAAALPSDPPKDAPKK